LLATHPLDMNSIKFQPQPLPPMLSEDLELLVFLGELKAIRKTTQGSAEVLIQWTDLPNF